MTGLEENKGDRAAATLSLSIAGSGASPAGNGWGTSPSNVIQLLPASSGCAPDERSRSACRPVGRSSCPLQPQSTNGGVRM
ncbi:hypothetical protein Q8A67_024497 [Cirrhinus molitorella]|uniref:Uncharacterized protein n=1 Tax=Cirrhinus molitorella TaxID=172907 RepID=A0AA88P227_9TELE|nr:hypothetical protein Q8A67_024497 [Cirrhinus molitorella]